MKFEGTKDYIATEDLRIAVNAAVTLERPLLIKGEPGTGKTVLAEEVSKALKMPLITWHIKSTTKAQQGLYEYDAITRLRDSQLGDEKVKDIKNYIKQGKLWEAFESNERPILLIDEIEKAHPDIFNILLQIMDYGKLKDQNGKNIDFRNVILIMTTNAGASELSKSSIGFLNDTKNDADTQAIEKLFTPEFRNRLDAVIPFDYLDIEVIKMVVDKFIMQLEAQLSDKGVSIMLSDEARNWLAKKGYDKIFGARPLNRLIQEKIKKPLAEELLFGKLVKGGNVFVDNKKDELIIKSESSTKTPDKRNTKIKI